MVFVKREEEKILEKAFHEDITEQRIVVCPGITADIERFEGIKPILEQVIDERQVRHVLMRHPERGVAEAVKFRVPLGVVHVCIIPYRSEEVKRILENRSNLVEEEEAKEQPDDLEDVEQVDEFRFHDHIIPHSGEEASLEKGKCLVSFGRKWL